MMMPEYYATSRQSRLRIYGRAMRVNETAPAVAGFYSMGGFADRNIFNRRPWSFIVKDGNHQAPGAPR
jgi:hypothetical protein